MPQYFMAGSFTIRRQSQISGMSKYKNKDDIANFFPWASEEHEEQNQQTMELLWY